MKRLALKRLENVIYPVGFYRTKAKQIRQICGALLSAHGGEVPDSIDELLTLTGVGRKTANLVVTVGYKKPGICVDVHVHRISNRWGYVKTPTPDVTEDVLRSKLPRRYWITFNDLLVPFGQNLCRPVSPFCSQCKLTAFCQRMGVTSSRWLFQFPFPMPLPFQLVIIRLCSCGISFRLFPGICRRNISCRFFRKAAWDVATTKFGQISCYQIRLCYNFVTQRYF